MSTAASHTAEVVNEQQSQTGEDNDKQEETQTRLYPGGDDSGGGGTMCIIIISFIVLTIGGAVFMINKQPSSSDSDTDNSSTNSDDSEIVTKQNVTSTANSTEINSHKHNITATDSAKNDSYKHKNSTSADTNIKRSLAIESNYQLIQTTKHRSDVDTSTSRSRDIINPRNSMSNQLELNNGMTLSFNNTLYHASNSSKTFTSIWFNNPDNYMYWSNSNDALQCIASIVLRAPSATYKKNNLRTSVKKEALHSCKLLTQDTTCGNDEYAQLLTFPCNTTSLSIEGSTICGNSVISFNVIPMNNTKYIGSNKLYNVQTGSSHRYPLVASSPSIKFMMLLVASTTSFYSNSSVIAPNQIMQCINMN